MDGAQCVGALRQLQAINARWARDQDNMYLLRCLFSFRPHFKFTLPSALPSAHVQGAKNSIADAISHTQIVTAAKTLFIDPPRASGYPCTPKGVCARQEVGLDIPVLGE